MKKTILAVVALMMTGCGSSNVYDDTIPAYDDSDALLTIRDGLRPEDRSAWQAVTMRIINPVSSGVQSVTVGEAIQRQKAKEACFDENDLTKAGEMPTDFGAPGHEERRKAYITGYNKLVEGYNACAKMVV